MNQVAQNTINYHKVTRWIVFSVLLPLFPMLVAVLVLSGRGEAVRYENLLGGTEIYILSVTVLASTKNDLDNSKADFSRSRAYKWLTVLLLPYAIFMSMVFGVVYINAHIQEIGLAQSFVADVGIGLGIIASVICISLQILLSIRES